MATIRIKGDKAKYSVKDRECLGRECLALSHYQTRGATLGGSRNTGDSSPCCINRAYRGCPTPIPEFDKALAAKRKADGMKVGL